MKQQVFYIHGGNAYSDYEAFLHNLRTTPIRDLPNAEPMKKWTETLRTDLGDDFEVFMPTMPNAKNAKYQEWKIWFERHLEYLQNDIVLVGWSLGGYFFAKYLLEETLPVRVRALFLVAAPCEPADFDGEDGGDFVFDPVRIGELQEKAQNIVIFHSTDDFVVPYEHALQYQSRLPEATLVTFSDRNHFLIPTFPELLEHLKALT